MAARLTGRQALGQGEPTRFKIRHTTPSREPPETPVNENERSTMKSKIEIQRISYKSDFTIFKVKSAEMNNFFVNKHWPRKVL